VIPCLMLLRGGVRSVVLGVFGVATPERVALSDSICTALQIVEHLQDVGEDYTRGRIYLPREDMARFGCDENALGAESVAAITLSTVNGSG